MNIIQRIGFKYMKPLLTTAMIACGITILILVSLLFKLECQAMSEGMGREWRHELIGGCYIQDNSGEFIPTKFINIDITK